MLKYVTAWCCSSNALIIRTSLMFLCGQIILKNPRLSLGFLNFVHALESSGQRFFRAARLAQK